jgi:opacity protein-like surface antigen
MKKILLIVSSTIVLANSVLAQEAADKKYRFGLRVAPTPTWLRSDESKFISKSGTKFGLGFGLQVEFRINSTASFVTGVGGDFLGGKQNYNYDQGYVLSKDGEYVDSKTIDFTKSAEEIKVEALLNGNKFYELKSRSIKATYITIPVLLKLMTKDIGGFKYFGIFGGNIGIQSKFKATDEITELAANVTGTTTVYNSGTSSLKIDEMRPSGDLIPFNIGLNAGLGAEYNLSGSTSVFFSINYLRGFINNYQKNSEIMVDKMKDNINNSNNIGNAEEPIRSKQSAFSDGIQVNIGILF